MAEEKQLKKLLRSSLAEVLEINTDNVKEKHNTLKFFCDEHAEDSADFLTVALDDIISERFYEQTAPQCYLSFAVFRLKQAIEEREHGPFADKMLRLKSNKQLFSNLKVLKNKMDSDASSDEISEALDEIIKITEPGNYCHRLFKQTQRQINDYFEHLHQSPTKSI